MRLHHLATASALLFLAACASVPEPDATSGNWAAQRQRIEAIEYFTASGKITLRTAEQAESASLLWQQLGESSHLRLSGPMGLSATTVDSNGQQVVIRQGDETRRWDIDDPAPEYTLGWSLPLRALQYWLKGVPAPGLELEELSLDPEGKLPRSLRRVGRRDGY